MPGLRRQRPGQARAGQSRRARGINPTFLTRLLSLQPKPPKYRNRKTEYGGALYDSRKEAEYARGLDLLLKAGDISAWMRQDVIPLMVNGTVVARMRVDFTVFHNDGGVEYVEVKGYPTRDWKLKVRLLRALRPDIRYTVA